MKKEKELKARGGKRRVKREKWRIKMERWRKKVLKKDELKK